MIIGGSAQVNNENQFPSQKKISENSRPSVNSTVPRRLFLQRLAQERHLQRIIDDVANYFVPAVIFIAISAGVGWYLVGVTGATFSVTDVTFSLVSFFSAIILAVVLVLLILLVLLR
jgi:cation transport ATPase